jgi:lipoyl(octanoyl) transferase
MNDFVTLRNLHTFDEIWFVEHYPIFTQGQSQTQKNMIFSNMIPIVKTNRGGQITYHGPGQQILYFLIDIRRRKISIRTLIKIMQIIVVETLKKFSLHSYIKNLLPGVYVNKKKICSLGLRVQNGSTLHGLALNVNMDLTPFSYIYPCGDKNIQMTQIQNFYPNIQIKDVRKVLIQNLSKFFDATFVNVLSR